MGYAAASRVVRLVHKGQVEMLMKGSLHTDEVLAAVISRNSGIRTERRISHIFAMDVPTCPKLLLVTDAAVNVAPGLAQKADIIQNAIDLAHTPGIDQSTVAILSAMEPEAILQAVCSGLSANDRVAALPFMGWLKGRASANREWFTIAVSRWYDNG